MQQHAVLRFYNHDKNGQNLIVTYIVGKLAQAEKALSEQCSDIFYQNEARPIAQKHGECPPPELKSASAR